MKAVQKIFLLAAGLLLSASGAYAQAGSPDVQAPAGESASAAEDSIRYRAGKLYPEYSSDFSSRSNAGLDSVSNVNTSIQYDPLTGNYYVRSEVGDDEVGTPFYMSEEEFDDYNSLLSLHSYYLARNREEKEKKNKFTLTDMQFDIGRADRVFGPGGVKLQLQGSVELDFGLNFRHLGDPSLSERSQHPAPTFDFDEKIQLAVDGSVGEKIKFNLNYNTEATFDYDQSLVKLSYKGLEDDIIKNIEVGNVSMPLTGSLITGNTSLFGMKADLQFGKLSVSAVISQQESESQTLNTSGAQTIDFEIKADDYDENRHYFLTHYFREHYDEWMSDLPNISSGITIGEIEVWITNRNSTTYDNTANVVGFADIGEPSTIYNPSFSPTGDPQVPGNKANTLYAQVIQGNGGLPDIFSVDSYLAGFGMSSDIDYVKIEGARKLEASEYTVNKQLGYISLKSALNNDEMLAVAFQYTYNGRVYTVGELSSSSEPTRPYALKLLKTTESSSEKPTWDLMMKNVYSLGAYQVQKDKFSLSVVYRNDSVGINLNYLTEGPIAKENLLRVMNLDNLDKRNQKTSKGDGNFDFVEGYTIYAENGKIVFPVLEPFGSHLKKALGNSETLASKYVFQSLYDSLKTVAQEDAELNKYYLTGEYRATSGSQIKLNAMNVPRGSVKVTAGGRELVENVDFTVDYMMGTVTIVNEDIINLGTPVSVTLESQSLFNLKRKSLFGTHIDYAFNDHFNVGGTIMYLKEKTLTEQVVYGDDPVSNFMWGLNASYRNQFQSITDFLNRIPILNLKQPSTLAFNAEFAQMVPGTAPGANGKIYIDDFESAKVSYDVRYAANWKLASTPSRFDESTLSNNIEYGKNRALLAWYYIDNLFTRSTTSTPSHIRNDKEQLSNHYVREITEQEVYPNKELTYGQSSYIQTLDLAYYPRERGPYNVFAGSYGSDGRLTDPQSKWGGIMRRMETTDFETNNIEYLEFWLLDPFIYDNGTAQGGDFYINLGNVSEDILKDGHKSYENGLPSDGSTTSITETVWGKVSTKQSISYAFDNSTASRAVQDVGLNGLSTAEEFNFSTYADFVSELTAKLSATALDSLRADSFSPLNDPAGDNFHHYRGTDYDNAQTSILQRYKRYNGTEGNSPAGTTNESYTTAATNDPDAEDINVDNTMNTAEKYFEYHVSLRPSDMVVGTNFITDMVTSTVTLENGETSSVRWYQFKIPLRDKDSYEAVGGMNSFKTIRFMRMYLTGFSQDINLRFASMELVRGEWRTYSKALDATYHNEAGTIEMSTVNIEENASKAPVNYVLPPGVTRQIDNSQQQVIQENEQSLSMKVLNLTPKDSRALYKSLGGYDMRQYGHIVMYVHAEALTDGPALEDNDVSLFMRLGSDYQNNYYEYEIPLKVTPEGVYSNNSTADRQTVWPTDNMIDFDLSLLTNLKKARNTEKNRSGSSVTNLTAYSMVDPSKPNNTMTIKGNPTLGEVDVIMIGVRNGSRTIKSAEVWVDDIMLTGFDQDGGVAALASVDLALAEFITLSAAGRIETSGWGGIEQSVTERRQDDYYQYNFNVGIDLGKLFPDKANVLLPIRFSYSNEISNPKYSPFEDDLLLSDVLSTYANAHQRDSLLNLSQSVYTNKSLSIPGIRVGMTGKKGPRPWDPANFTIGGSYSETSSHDPNTVRTSDQYYNAYGTYEFNWDPKPWEPFGKIRALKQSRNWKWISDIGINYAPKRFAFNTNFTREYYEEVLRDYSSGTLLELDPTFDKDFTWANKFDIAWDITKNIHLTLSTNNLSRIKENEGGVNKKLYPSEFEAWKDSVNASLAHLGNPMEYYQQFNATYNVPFSKIPFLNWLTGNLKYTGTYDWVYGNETIYSTASSKGTWSVDGRVNFETLYNKSKYLKEVNRKYGSSRGRRSNANRRTTPKAFEKSLEFDKGDTVVVAHNLNTKDLDVSATRNGKKYRLRFKKLDNNTIRFVARDAGKINLNIQARSSETAEHPGLDVASRILMLVRNLSFNYSQTDATVLPGFKPSVTFLGLSGYNGATAPGWDFVFGVQDQTMLDRAINNGWLEMSSAIYNPAVMSHTETFKATMLIEPWPGLKINVAADRQYARSNSVQYNTESRLSSLDGSLSMSYVAIGTSFASMLKSGSFDSDLFSNFLANRSVIKRRLEQKYNPSTGYSLNSDDVLVPAFIAAYAGRDAESVSLDLIQSFWSFLPNWQVTFDGLSRIPWVKQHFRSINLRHAYNCKYQIGSFTSDQSYAAVSGDAFGYVQDELNESLLPTARYQLNTVTITEQFSPLIGVDFNLKNSLSFKVEWKKGRTLGLNLASNQIVESWNNEYVVGVGYRFSDLSFTLKQASRQKKVKNDLTLRLDFSLKDAETIVRKIETVESQATSGDMVVAVNFSADYILSERISLRAYYDMQLRNPLVSTSYSTTTHDFGVAVKILLTR